MTTRPDSLAIDFTAMPAEVLKALRWTIGITGAISIILGVVLAVWPGRTLVVGAALLAINVLIMGVIRVAIGAFGGAYSAGMRVLSIILGVLLVVGAVVALRNLTASAALLLLITVIMIGFSWIIDGIVTIVDLRNARSRVWAIVSGLLSIVGGIFVLAVPGLSAALFLWIAAIGLVVTGIFAVVRAFALKSEVTVVEATVIEA